IQIELHAPEMKSAIATRCQGHLPRFLHVDVVLVPLLHFRDFPSANKCRFHGVQRFTNQTTYSRPAIFVAHSYWGQVLAETMENSRPCSTNSGKRGVSGCPEKTEYLGCPKTTP